MKCCKCSCSFAKCVEEHKNNLNKEFDEMITNWMKNHPEVKKVWIGDKSHCMLNFMIIHPNSKFIINIQFE